MKPIREHLKKGKLYFATYKAVNGGTLDSRRFYKVGTPHMFLSYKGSSLEDVYSFLIGEKKENYHFTYGPRDHARKHITDYFMPLHHLEWHLTSWNEQA
jgi:hypothetical protein